MIALPRRMELAWLAAVPALLTLALAAVTLAFSDSLASIMPVLPLLPVFYWATLLPRAIPVWFVFLLGLVVDSASGLPLGFSSLAYMLFLGLLYWKRRHIHKEGFAVKWRYFAGALAAVLLAEWLCLSWVYARLLPVPAVLVQWAVTAGCYPLAHAAFDTLDRWMYERRWKILHGR